MTYGSLFQIYEVTNENDLEDFAMAESYVSLLCFQMQRQMKSVINEVKDEKFTYVEINNN